MHTTHHSLLIHPFLSLQKELQNQHTAVCSIMRVADSVSHSFTYIFMHERLHAIMHICTYYTCMMSECTYVCSPCVDQETDRQAQDCD